jgi:hypothetical protein
MGPLCVVPMAVSKVAGPAEIEIRYPANLLWSEDEEPDVGDKYTEKHKGKGRFHESTKRDPISPRFCNPQGHHICRGSNDRAIATEACTKGEGPPERIP